MFVSIMAFFARISDPAVGGTYMTFLNTLTNLGGNWPATLALWWVDVLTYKKCDLSSLVDFKSQNMTNTQIDEFWWLEPMATGSPKAMIAFRWIFPAIRID